MFMAFSSLQLKSLGLGLLVHFLTHVSPASSRVAQQTTETVFASSGSRIGECKININKHLEEPQPLLVHPRTHSLVLPSDTGGLIVLSSGAEVEFHCTEGFRSRHLKSTVARARCLEGTDFQFDNQKTSIRDFKCKRNSRHLARVVGKCLNDSKLIDVGYEIKEPPRFLQLFQICFDNVSDRTIFASNVLTPVHVRNQDHVPRPHFITGPETAFTSRGVDKLYSRRNQAKVMSQMLGLNESEIKMDESNSVTRGHLVPKADFILGAHQRASFYLENTAPQFAKFNAGNWAKIENAVRSFASKTGTDLRVFTGTFGVLRVRDRQNVAHEYFLNRDENNNGLLPVPTHFYKVVIDEGSQRGVVLIGVNDPFASPEEILENYVVCPDVSEQIKWVKVQMRRNRPIDGYYFACDVQNFRKIVDYLPLGTVKELLV